jgi:hypothetical protein
MSDTCEIFLDVIHSFIHSGHAHSFVLNMASKSLNLNTSPPSIKNLYESHHHLSVYILLCSLPDGNAEHKCDLWPPDRNCYNTGNLILLSLWSHTWLMDHAVPGRSWEVTAVFNFISECILLSTLLFQV